MRFCFSVCERPSASMTQFISGFGRTCSVEHNTYDADLSNHQKSIWRAACLKGQCWAPCYLFYTLPIWHHWLRTAVFHHICTLTTLWCTVLADQSMWTHCHRTSLIASASSLTGCCLTDCCWIRTKPGSSGVQQVGASINYPPPHCWSTAFQSPRLHPSEIWGSTSMQIWACGHTFNEQYRDMLRCAPATTPDSQRRADGHVPFVGGRSGDVQTGLRKCVLVGLPTRLVRRLQ